MTGRTTEQVVAAAMGHGLDRLDALRIVAELQEAGIAEMTDDGLWRLTPWAEERFGQIFCHLGTFGSASSAQATEALDSDRPIERAGTAPTAPPRRQGEETSMPYPQGNPARPSPLLSASLDLISASDVEFGEDGDHIVAFRVPADAWCVWTEKVVMEAFAEGVERATAVPVDADRPPGTSGSWGEA